LCASVNVLPDAWFNSPIKERSLDCRKLNRHLDISVYITVWRWIIVTDVTAVIPLEVRRMLLGTLLGSM